MATVVGIYILALSGFLRLVSAVFPSRFLFLHYFVLSLSLSPLALCQIVLPAVLVPIVFPCAFLCLVDFVYHFWTACYLFFSWNKCSI